MRSILAAAALVLTTSSLAAKEDVPPKFLIHAQCSDRAALAWDLMQDRLTGISFIDSLERENWDETAEKILRAAWAAKPQLDSNPDLIVSAFAAQEFNNCMKGM